MVSIIVPIYKVEKYLDKCIESIVNQTYKDIEIILVDDGSPDRCPEMCEVWAKKDNRIKVLHKENGGISEARNAGMDLATGDYVGFVDSDDYIHEDMYKILMQEMEKSDADVVCCKYVDVNEDGEVISRTAGFFDEPNYNVIYKDRDFVHALLENRSMPVVWNKLFKKNVVDEYYFKHNTYSEDYLFLLHIAYEEMSIVFITDTLYYYTAREDSITGGFKEGYNLDQVKNVFSVEKLLMNRFGDDIEVSLKTAQFKAIRLFLARMPYSYIRNKAESYKYVYAKLKENKKYILKKNNNNNFDKAFLSMFFISKWFTKTLFDFLVSMMKKRKKA